MFPAPGMRRGQCARAHERKRRRSRAGLRAEAASPLRTFFTGGVEFDDGLEPRLVEAITSEAMELIERLAIPAAWGAGVELKLRRLQRHRADGLYYPEQRILVLDPRVPTSFCHELGHLIDYRAGEHVPTRLPSAVWSSSSEFRPFHCALVAAMRRIPPGDPRVASRRGRLTWSYFASSPECFARSFEQSAVELLSRTTLLARGREDYQRDPFFFERVPPGLIDFFRTVLARPPTESPAAIAPNPGEFGPFVVSS